MKLEVVSPDRIIELGEAFRGSKALLSAIELGVFTALADGPLELEVLRERVGLNERGARDFLDALVALGMLVRHDNRGYANTVETDHYLDRNKASYVGGMLESSNARLYGVWGSLTAALRTGKPQCDRSVVGNFGPLYADEASREAFVQSMTTRTRPVAKSLANRFPWMDHSTLIDIGGAQGCLPVEIARVHPHITGGAFDLPPLRHSFDRLVNENGLADRLCFYPGDFFNDPLPTADVLVMGRVLHNWDMAAKKLLLRKAYDALPPAGILIVYERLIDDKRRINVDGLLMSLHMLLVSPGGFDFTGADCIGWMRETGFRDIRVKPLTADQSMVVGTK
jgi:O-methyltransferase/methyltransferase family protein